MIENGKAASGTPLHRLRAALQSNPDSSTAVVYAGDVQDVCTVFGCEESYFSKRLAGERPSATVLFPMDELRKIVDHAFAPNQLEDPVAAKEELLIGPATVELAPTLVPPADPVAAKEEVACTVCEWIGSREDAVKIDDADRCPECGELVEAAKN